MNSRDLVFRDTDQDKNAIIVSYVVHEGEMARMERSNRRLFILLIIAIVLLFVSNAFWIKAWTDYDYSSNSIDLSTDGGGNANYIGGNGDVTNGESTSADKNQD